MKRIVLFPSAYAPAVGGVEELTRNLGRALRAAGDEVEVWTIRHPPGLPAESVVDGVRVRRFSLPLPTKDVSAAVAFPLGATRALAGLTSALRAFRPDVLHVQCYSANGAYAWLLSRLCRVPLVVSLQGETVMDDNDIYDHSQSLRRALRHSLQDAEGVTGCSAFVLADAAARFGLPSGRGEVIPNGVDLDETRHEQALPAPFERFVLGLGRVVPKKGFDLLLEAFALVAREHSDLGLVIGGDGVARPDLETRARDLGLESRVWLPGALTRPQVAWAMRTAAAFALPSRVEPFGIVVLEALRGGCPAVVSSRGGTSDIVQDGIEALVADPLDPSAFAGALRRVLEDGQLADRLRRAGAKRLGDFAWPRVAERYRDLYDAITVR